MSIILVVCTRYILKIKESMSVNKSLKGIVTVEEESGTWGKRTSVCECVCVCVWPSK